MDKKKHFNEKISNCEKSKALFSVASEMKGTTNRNPSPTNTPTKDLLDVLENFSIPMCRKLENLLTMSAAVIHMF